MKKKILTLCLVVALASTAVVGGTLAYFTDTDVQTNVFTYGNVKIDLFEDFNTDGENIVPAVFVPAYEGAPEGYGTMINKIEKEVYVENEGTEEVYTRVHIAVPKIADAVDTEDVIPARYDILNLSRDEYTTVDGAWNWGKSATDSYNNGVRNSYEVVIRGIPYVVYVVTYETKLDATNTTVTCDAINGVYMHSNVTQEMITALDQKYVDEYGSPIWARVYVVAEAAQADGFGVEVTNNGATVTPIAGADTDGTAAFQALNTAFGDPAIAGDDGGQLSEADFLAASEGDTFKEWIAKNGN